MSGGASFVTVVQAADFPECDQVTLGDALHASGRWRVFRRREVSSRSVIGRKIDGAIGDAIARLIEGIREARPACVILSRNRPENQSAGWRSGSGEAQETSGLADGETLMFGPDGKGGAVLMTRIKIEQWPTMKF